jgi:hypothetical protein
MAQAPIIPHDKFIFIFLWDLWGGVLLKANSRAHHLAPKNGGCPGSGVFCAEPSPGNRGTRRGDCDVQVQVFERRASLTSRPGVRLSQIISTQPIIGGRGRGGFDGVTVPAAAHSGCQWHRRVAISAACCSRLRLAVVFRASVPGRRRLGVTRKPRATGTQGARQSERSHPSTHWQQ